MHVDIKDTKGSVFLSLINIERDQEKPFKKKLLGAVEILLKSEFQEGIYSPIKMALIDNRIKDPRDCIFGVRVLCLP